MSRLPSAAQSLPARGYHPKRTSAAVRASESICDLCHLHTAKSTDSASQTMDLDDEYFLKDAIIRFPRRTDRVSVKAGEPPSHNNEHSTQTEIEPVITSTDRNTTLGMGIENGEGEEELEETSKNRVTSKLGHRMGQVPKYLIQRKKELAHAQATVNEAPLGHYLLSEEERVEALQLAQGRYDHLIQQLNALSITSQTMRTRTRRIDIETELQSLDNTLKIFSRKRVFVNLGE